MSQKIRLDYKWRYACRQTWILYLLEGRRLVIFQNMDIRKSYLIKSIADAAAALK